ncbi:I78 family peptidase inhibitor [Palleronia abyssalis]|uniref:Peptidase inhibitor I78 family protein n=1 Tax=Palleronia abyssalis TaxID=1501240 RepID=A0A2R8BSZ0_9RHOB|nr:I78 family peptidase inhibitor [Palleronia abyssalis]SPJ23307.1 hypothetical protein PAA8504_01117 [Palleronia abyssalis]
MLRIVFLILPLAACQVTAPQATPDTCEAVAERVSARIGTPVAEVDATGPEGRRVIGPNDMVTMDYVEGRLNLKTDADGTLTRAYCG